VIYNLNNNDNYNRGDMTAEEIKNEIRNLNQNSKDEIHRWIKEEMGFDLLLRVAAPEFRRERADKPLGKRCALSPRSMTENICPPSGSQRPEG
jgi:hypothetical protein